MSLVIKSGGVDLFELLHALRAVLVHAYGEDHFRVDQEALRQRRTLYKFINLVSLISILDDIDHFACGFKCPLQLDEYSKSLRASIELATQNGLSATDRHKALVALRCLEDVQQEITLYHGGLS